MTTASPLDRPMLFCLHFLGGSHRTWTEVIGALGPSWRCRPIDLPGFGEATGSIGYSVAEMAEAVATRIRAEGAGRWMLAGHSMGAKVALAVARRAEDGEAGLAGLAGLVLLGGSPPAPEPMADERRAAMMGWFAGDAASRRAEAEDFIDQNSAEPLPDVLRESAVADVLRTHRDAWTAWLTHGSREDWSDRIGVLRTPALILAGDGDADLGVDAQGRLTMRHLSRGRIETLAASGHLLPLERPVEIARLITAFADEADVAGGPTAEWGDAVDTAYLALITSDRVSERTRRTLLDRARPTGPSAQPTCLTPALLATLRAVVDRMLPQSDGARIDLATRLDRALSAGPGDGWRFAALPPDAEAMRAGLMTLDEAAHAEQGCAFAAIADRDQDRLLAHAADGTFAPGAFTLGAFTPGALSPEQMKLWFADLRAAAIRTYVSHPATLARMGYSGIANGGDGARKQGFVRVGAGEREPWEPEARS